MAEHSYRRCDIKPFSKRGEHFCNPIGCGFEAIERRVAAGAEGGPACLTPESLDTFSLAVCTVTNQSVDLRVGNQIVRARTMWAGKSVCGNSLGSAPTAFAMAPRRYRNGEGRGSDWDRRLLATARAIIRCAGLEQALDLGGDGWAIPITPAPPHPDSPGQQNQNQEDETT
jgi:hypothetical protein